MSKVKVLFLAADPFKQNALSLDEEIRAITARIRAAEYRDTLELVSAWAVRRGDLQELLLQHRPTVVHFSGHGTKGELTGSSYPGRLVSGRDLIAGDDGQDAQLVLMGEGGQPQPVSKDALVDLFDVLKDNIRLVVFNACHTKPQAEAIAQFVDSAIGMNTAIGDAAAIVFAAAFYQALGFGRDLRTAFKLGKNALKMEGIREDQTPELFVRDGLDAAKLVLVTPPTKPDEDARPHQESLGGGPTKSFRSTDRSTFVKTLGMLSPPTFELLVASIEGAAVHVGRHGTVPEHAAELVRWAESSTGPGLTVIKDALENFR
jgi:hypothetical protein